MLIGEEIDPLSLELIQVLLTSLEEKKGKNMGNYMRKDVREYLSERNPHRLLSRKEAADFLGVKEITLAIWKSTNRYNIPVVKVGRLVRYRYGDLLAFVERRTINKPEAANDNQDLL